MVEGQPAHRDRLTLGADGVRQVHDARHKECDRQLCGQCLLKARHNESSDHAAGQTDQQPRQALARTRERCGADRVQCLVVVLADTDQALHVLDVFAPQDCDECLRRHAPDQVSDCVHHRHGRHTRINRQRGDMLLIHIR